MSHTQVEQLEGIIRDLRKYNKNLRARLQRQNNARLLELKVNEAIEIFNMDLTKQRFFFDTKQDIFTLDDVDSEDFEKMKKRGLRLIGVYGLLPPSK